MTDDEDMDDEPWDSGAFCRHHYYALEFCEECRRLCACGHAMFDHVNSRYCEPGHCEDCECERFVEAEVSK